MSSPEGKLEAVDSSALVRSGVKIEDTAKDFPVVKVSAYEGTTQTEMQECVDLAVNAYNAARRQLGLAPRTPRA